MPNPFPPPPPDNRMWRYDKYEPDVLLYRGDDVRCLRGFDLIEAAAALMLSDARANALEEAAQEAEKLAPYAPQRIRALKAVNP